MPDLDFNSINLRPELKDNLSSLGYHTMTPIQAQSLHAICKGQDLIGQAQTGSGKTVAFGLGVLQNINVKRFRVQALILCPTRELADQVAKELRKLARAVHNIKVLTLCGGMPFGPQVGSLEHGAHIVVGTPGRIEEHLRKQLLNLNELNTLVLDEADRMLDMGFKDTLDTIIAYAPKTRQTLLFSATFPDEIHDVTARVMRSPHHIKVESAEQNTDIKQIFYRVTDEHERVKMLKALLLEHQSESSVVFCHTKRETQEIADLLRGEGFSAAALHGDLEQRERDINLIRFANSSVSVLVATDVAARGLDIKGLDLVINYQLSRDPQVHTHRIGRTGRAGSSGLACSLWSEKERYKLEIMDIDTDYVNSAASFIGQANLSITPEIAKMVTLQIDAGKKQKIRAGDIVGALTATKEFTGDNIGKIDISDFNCFVAVPSKRSTLALSILKEGKIKGRQFKVRLIRR